MRRNFTYTTVLMVFTHQWIAPLAIGQQVRIPSPGLEAVPGTAGYQPPPSTYPYTSPGAAPYVPPGTAPYTTQGAAPYTTPGTLYPTVTAPGSMPPPALPPAAQPQAVQNLVGDAQRYGLPFDPYAQPAQYVGPAVAPPPAPYATPYATTPAPASSFAFPALSPSWGGFYIGADGTILEARGGGATIVTPGDYPVGASMVDVPITSLEFIPDYSLEFSPRVWGGYKGAAGFGVRGRWWYYNHGASGVFNFNPLVVGVPEPIDTDMPPDGVADVNVLLESTSLRTNLKVNSIDLEGTQDGNFHNWDFQIAGGIRYAKIEYNMSGMIAGTIEDPIGELPAGYEDFTDTITAYSEFSGVGPTIALSGRRPMMFADGLAFLVGVRLAFLFGDSDVLLTTENAFATPITSTSFEENLVQAWEIQVGFEYSRQLQSGARLFGAALLEAQVWEWNSPLGASGGDLGFFGPTISFGIAR